MPDNNTKDSVSQVVEKAGATIDKHMEKVAKNDFVDSFVNIGIIKTLLDSTFIRSIDDFIRPYFKLLMQIIGVIALIGGVLGLLGALGGFGMLFTIGFQGSGFVVVFILAVVGSFLAIIEGYGLLYAKKWIPFLMIVVFLRSILSVIFNQLFWSTTVYVGYRTGNYVVSFVLSAIVLLVVLRNRSYFSQ